MNDLVYNNFAVQLTITILSTHGTVVSINSKQHEKQHKRVREEGNGSNYDAILPRMLYLYVKYGSFFDWITQQLAIISNLMESKLDSKFCLLFSEFRPHFHFGQTWSFTGILITQPLLFLCQGNENVIVYMLQPKQLACALISFN